MSLDALATRLTASGAVSTGWTLWKGFMPDKPNNSICLVETGSNFSAGARAHANQTPMFQIRVRASTYVEAREKWQECFEALQDGTLPVGIRHLQFVQDSPLPFQDNLNRTNLTASFWCVVPK